MRKCLFLFILLLAGLSYVSSFNYREINRQIDDKIYFEIFEEEILVDKGFFDITSSKEGFFFLKKVKFNDNYDYAEVWLILDYGYFLSDFGINPSNYELSTDGRLIKVKWVFENIKKGEEKTFFAILERTKEENDFPYILISIFFLLFLIAVISAYLIYKNRKKDLKIFLLDEEKRIIDFLKKCDRNECWQKNIQKELNFSKAKLSRLIRNLEARGIIKKIPFGNTNKIVLK
ncbi:MAG: hypothetical protein QXX68_00010 [Candidatus Pacearchaeota archaeon]